MAESDVFLDRLTDALRSYAADGPTVVEPMELARSISLAHPRRSGARVWFDVTRGRRSILVLAVLLALLLASTVGILTVGRLLRSADPVVQLVPEHPIPRTLYGEWQLNRGGGVTDIPPNALMIDFTGPVFIRLPGGAPAEWAGRAVAFTPTTPVEGDLLIRASGPCGDARYRVSGIGTDDVSETSGALTKRIVLDAIADPCPERADILADSISWVRPLPIGLVAGQTYDSWAFTEPFHFTAQAFDLPEGRSTGSVQQWGTRGGLRMWSAYHEWSLYLIDDQPLGIDACDLSSGELSDVPATPDAVGAWLRSSSRLTVAAAVPLQVDGRTAIRYDLVGDDGEHASGGCGATLFQPPNIRIGQTVYAIPTGDDTILIAAKGHPIGLAEFERGVDALVRSMTFD